MAIVKKYKAEITEIKKYADNIFTVEFKSLNGIFKFSPGQFLHLSLDEYDPSMCWPESRCFSIQTSPTINTIKITYAVKGEFTNRMATTLKKGKEVMLKLPYGDLFIREHNKINTVFIAGGTGITPFLSLFNDPSFSTYINPILFAGFRNPRMNLYQKELKKAMEINPTLSIFILFEDTDGKLDIEKIFLGNGIESTYFLSGPESMIEFFNTFLLKNKVPSQNIFMDRWN
jgi:ferredoxin-NADP reductase